MQDEKKTKDEKWSVLFDKVMAFCNKDLKPMEKQSSFSYSDEKRTGGLIYPTKQLCMGGKSKHTGVFRQA